MLILSTSFDSVTRHDSTSNNLGVPALFGKIDFNWSAVDISICLHLSEGHICIFCSIPKVVSTLPVSTPKNGEETHDSFKSPQSPQSLGKTVKRAEKSLPKQDKKKTQVLSQVISEMSPRKRTAGVVTYQFKEGQLKKVEGRSDQIPLMKNKGS